jgi:hypothetical protein
MRGRPQPASQRYREFIEHEQGQQRLFDDATEQRRVDAVTARPAMPATMQ